MLKGKYPWMFVGVLFLIACGVKWFYLAQQHYYVVLSDELFGAYNFAENYDVPLMLQRIFPPYCDCSLGSVRPFFTTLLYFLTLKGFGFQPQVMWVLGILVGSLLVPLYFLVIGAMINVEVALASSLMLSWMSNYIGQSVALSTILPGILFTVGALLAAVRYHQKGGVGYLLLAGGLVSMSVFCRYENAVLVPAFIGYEYLFDKGRPWLRKSVFGLLCAGSSLYILFCNYHKTGDPFHAIRQQNLTAFHCSPNPPILWSRAFEIVGGLLLKLWGPFVWGAAITGMGLMIVRHKLKALWFFLGALSLPLFLIYKVKQGSLDYLENYFFLLALVALPVGLECVRGLVSRAADRRGYGMIALGMIVLCSIYSFHRFHEQPPASQAYYSGPIRVTEDLKNVPATAALYIDDDLGRCGFECQTMLVYLRRNPIRYQYYPGRTRPPEKEYYLLTKKNFLGKTAQGEGVKARDYRADGCDDLALYRMTRT